MRPVRGCILSGVGHLGDRYLEFNEAVRNLFSCDFAGDASDGVFGKMDGAYGKRISDLLWDFLMDCCGNMDCTVFILEEEGSADERKDGKAEVVKNLDNVMKL